MSVATTFNATYYLHQNADVAVAISQGFFADAAHHFNLFGAKELRDPNALFDASYYAEDHADVLSAVSAGHIANVFTHYQMFGEAENRAPSRQFEGFDAESYLAANADVQAAVTAGSFASALDHYIAFGKEEGRDGANVTPPTTPGETFTLTKNLDDFSAVGSGTVKGVLTASGDDNTWNVADKVSGGAGSTFDVTAVLGASRSTAGRSTDGIENFNIVLADGDSDSANTLSIDASTLVGADTFTLKSATASDNDKVSFAGLATSQTVTLQSDDDELDIDLGYKSGEDSGSDDTATVTLDGTDLQTVTVAGEFETVAVAGTGKSGIEVLDASDDRMTGLTVTGAGDTTLSSVTGFSDSATVTNIDASGASGAVTIGTVLSNKFTDTKGGTGTSDTLIATNTSDTTISSAFKSTGFETLLFTADTSNMRTHSINLTKSSDFTTVGVRGNNGATERLDTVTFSKIADKSTVVLQGDKKSVNQFVGNITATVKDVSSSEPGSLTVQINNRGKDVGLTGTTEHTIKAGTLTANNVEAFDITAADGDVAEFTLDANKLETVTVTASEDFVFSGTVGASAETTSIDMSGVAGKAQLTLVNDLEKDVDVTTGAGKDVVTLGDQESSDDNTITVSTGEGNDTFTTGQVSSNSVLSVDLGAGDDKVVITDNKDIKTTEDHRIDGGEGTDTIEFSGSSATDISTATLANFEKIVISGSANLSVQAASLNGATTEISTFSTGRVVAQGTANDDTIDLSKLALVGPNGVNADGGAGADTITASKKGDAIDGGAGADTLTGGDGEDTFNHDLATDSGDSITDFTVGSDDFILTTTGLVDSAGDAVEASAIGSGSFATISGTAAGSADLGADEVIIELDQSTLGLDLDLTDSATTAAGIVTEVEGLFAGNNWDTGNTATAYAESANSEDLLFIIYEQASKGSTTDAVLMRATGDGDADSFDGEFTVEAVLTGIAANALTSTEFYVPL